METLADAKIAYETNLSLANLSAISYCINESQRSRKESADLNRQPQRTVLVFDMIL